MAEFVGHGACPSCGSRNNLGRYSDGSAFCFGCRYTERREAGAFAVGRQQEATTAGLSRRAREAIFPEHLVEYLQRYELDVAAVRRYGGYWDQYREQLVFEYDTEDGELSCIQARNFNREKALKHKYYNQGSTHDVFDLMGANGKSKVVITEDKLSAIKVARQADAIPALGTQFQRHKAARLAALGYQRVYVWLDKDKWREGRDIADHCKWLGLSATALLTPLDPKEYTDEQIKEYLQ